MKMVDFRGRTVVVTGAASGIGREIARAFSRRGADLALADINEEGLRAVKEELESQGGRVYSQVVDVSVAEQVENFRDNVYGETRVVGYFSKIENWNKSKAEGELEDRHKGNYLVEDENDFVSAVITADDLSGGAE